MLHMNYRIYSKKMYLNSKHAGQNWLYYEIYIPNLEFTPGETVTLIAKAEVAHWVIYINGEQRVTYPHRLPAPTIKRMEFEATDDSGSELKSLQFFY